MIIVSGEFPKPFSTLDLRVTFQICQNSPDQFWFMRIFNVLIRHILFFLFIFKNMEKRFIFKSLDTQIRAIQ
ncbi:MAG: hypothetical protein EAZ99_10590 [Alphaproteobacteria bacterium]|nr:MAG: hypothetical protein EAZ99_10590 [Alphaproteobacteria bacterium]